MGDLSAHFSAWEFRCHHCGRLPSGGIPGALVDVLERLRSTDGRALPVVSGFRCSIHNKAVGGAPRSLHLLGRAADLPGGRFTIEEALSAGARGVGHCDGWVVHVDVRRISRPVIFEDC